MADLDSLIGSIYDAAFDVQRWPEVLEKVSDALGGGPTALLAQNQLNYGGAGVTVRMEAAALGAYYRDFGPRNPLLRKNNLEVMQTKRQFHTVTDRAVLERGELQRTEFYNEFMKPNGMHSCLMIGLDVHGETAVTCNIMRPAHRAEFEAEEILFGNTIRPHLARAFNLGLKLQEARQYDSALMAHLDRSPHGVFLLDALGRTIRVNESGDAMLRKANALRSENGMLAGVSPNATRKLREAIAAALAGPHGRGSLTLPRNDGGLALSAIIAPVNRSLSPFGSGPAAIICVSDPDAGLFLPEHQLRDLFGLTPAECGVALKLLDGHDLKAIGERLGIRVNTVRVHLSRVLDKTQTRRQVDLVRLLMRIVGMRAD